MASRVPRLDTSDGQPLWVVLSHSGGPHEKRRPDVRPNASLNACAGCPYGDEPATSSAASPSSVVCMRAKASDPRHALGGPLRQHSLAALRPHCGSRRRSSARTLIGALRLGTGVLRAGKADHVVMDRRTPSTPMSHCWPRAVRGFQRSRVSIPGAWAAPPCTTPERRVCCWQNNDDDAWRRRRISSATLPPGQHHLGAAARPSVRNPVIRDASHQRQPAVAAVSPLLSSDLEPW